MATMKSALYISSIICNPKAKHNLKDFSKYFARDKKNPLLRMLLIWKKKKMILLWLQSPRFADI